MAVVGRDFIGRILHVEDSAGDFFRSRDRLAHFHREATTTVQSLESLSGRSRRVERTLARPHEVPGVGLLDLTVAGLGEAEPPLRSLSPSRVRCDGRHEVQVVRVEPKDAQYPRET